MKKALLISDSHGMNENMTEVIDLLAGKVEAVFHMGDIVGGEGALQESASAIGCLSYVVKGNCDRNFDLRESNLIEFAGKRIVTCHGHLFGGYGGPEIDALRYFGEENNADLVAFGHTHRPFLEVFDSLIVCNPGSISQPRQEDRKKTFAILEVGDDGSMKVQHYAYENKKISCWRGLNP